MRIRGCISIGASAYRPNGTVIIYDAPAKSQFLLIYLKKYWSFFRLTAENNSFCSSVVYIKI